MAELPPTQLVAMLERLGLATSAEVARCGAHVRRLARDLPRFESVWIDALAQARILTPYQAAEINAGRGELLRVGLYVLCERLAEPCYAACYRAIHVETKETVRLVLVEMSERQAGAVLQEMETLVQRGRNVADSSETRSLQVVPVTDAGRDGGRIFAVSPWVEGRSAAEWLIHHGRLSSELVLEIARSMLCSLTELERAGICHGDVSVSSLVLSDSGRVVLLMPGLRGILRPEEGYAHDDLLPEAYDSLAPERVASGTRPDMSSDLYACGCLWWHLLCGRPPLAGGNSLMKLRAAQAAGICDVRRYAPDVPASLAGAVAACLDRERGRRPESFAQLASVLGLPTQAGQEMLADCLARTGRARVTWTVTARTIRKSNRTPMWIAGTVCGLATLLAVVWPLCRSTPPQSNFQPGNGMAIARLEGGKPESPDVGNHRNAGQSGAQTSTAGESIRHTASPLRELANDASRRIPQDRLSEPSAAHVADAVSSGETSIDETRQSNEVVATNYQQAVAPRDLVVSADGSMAVEAIEFQANQRVRGPAGRRGVLRISGDGLIVNQDGVRFENIDFVWNDEAIRDRKGEVDRRRPPRPDERRTQQNAYPVLVYVNASRADFRGCSFQSAEDSAVKPAAILWQRPFASSDAAMRLPSGRLRLGDCSFGHVVAGVDCREFGMLGIEIANTMYLGEGALLRLDHWPQADEAVSIALLQTTLRQSGPLLECFQRSGIARSGEKDANLGEIVIQSAGCVFAPTKDVPLLRFCSVEWSDQFPACIRWTGHGSLVLPETPICTWQASDSSEELVDEAALSIAGLVRSKIGFAGPMSGNPAASRVIRWQAPLQSVDPPGADPSPLPTTRLGGG